MYKNHVQSAMWLYLASQYKPRNHFSNVFNSTKFHTNISLKINIYLFMLAFLSLWQNTWAKQFKGREIHFWLKGFSPAWRGGYGISELFNSWQPGSRGGEHLHLAFSLFSFFPCGSPPSGMVPPTLRVELHTLVNPLWKPLTDTFRDVLY
jgi:hypothetical protein